MRAICCQALAAGFGLLLSAAALAQDGGDTTAGTAPDTVPSGQGGRGDLQVLQGSGLQGRRDALERQQHEAGIASPAEREAQQLRDLNAMSRELAPNAPLPAPEVGTPRR